MPAVYRAMHADATDEGPLIEDSARGLGVRADYDLPVDERGNVQPGGLGMTVRPSLGHIPRRLLKQPRFHVWELDTTELPAALNYVQDKPDHGVLEPAYEMSFEDYRDAIGETREIWIRI